MTYFQFAGSFEKLCTEWSEAENSNKNGEIPKKQDVKQCKAKKKELEKN